MLQKSKNTSVPSEAQAKEKLAFYVYEYLNHVGAPKTAQIFLKEAQVNWEKAPPLEDAPGFLQNWWNIFFDLYTAAPERRETIERPGGQPKSFHDYNIFNSGHSNGLIMGGGGGQGNSQGGPRLPGGPFMFHPGNGPPRMLGMPPRQNNVGMYGPGMMCHQPPPGARIIQSPIPNPEGHPGGMIPMIAMQRFRAPHPAANQQSPLFNIAPPSNQNHTPHSLALLQQQQQQQFINSNNNMNMNNPQQQHRTNQELNFMLAANNEIRNNMLNQNSSCLPFPPNHPSPLGHVVNNNKSIPSSPLSIQQSTTPTMMNQTTTPPLMGGGGPGSLGNNNPPMVSMQQHMSLQHPLQSTTPVGCIGNQNSNNPQVAMPTNIQQQQHPHQSNTPILNQTPPLSGCLGNSNQQPPQHMVSMGPNLQNCSTPNSASIMLMSPSSSSFMNHMNNIPPNNHNNNNNNNNNSNFDFGGSSGDSNNVTPSTNNTIDSITLTNTNNTNSNTNINVRNSNNPMPQFFDDQLPRKFENFDENFINNFNDMLPY